MFTFAFHLLRLNPIDRMCVVRAKMGEQRQWAGIWEASVLGGPQCCAFGKVAEVTVVEWVLRNIWC